MPKKEPRGAQGGPREAPVRPKMVKERPQVSQEDPNHAQTGAQEGPTCQNPRKTNGFSMVEEAKIDPELYPQR